MRALGAAAVAVVLVAGAALAAAQPSWGSAPSGLVVEPVDADLGVVPAGTEAVATFHLRNPGPRDVRILAARPS